MGRAYILAGMGRSTRTGAARAGHHGPSIRLASADVAAIDVALASPGLSEADVLAILLNRRATRRQVETIADDRRWNRNREVVRRVFRHPNAPIAFATRSLPLLRWGDLAEALDRPWLHPTLRSRAEHALRGRIEELTTGERVALARRAGRRAIPTFLASREERVLCSLLGNARLREAEVARLAGDPSAPAAFLRNVVDHPVWGGRRSVCLGLAANPRSPAATALRALGRLPTDDLRRLANDGKVPGIVRVGAARAIPEPLAPDGSSNRFERRHPGRRAPKRGC